MANNHSGSISSAKKIIDQCALVAKKFSINAAIKLQYRNLKNFIHPKYINKYHTSPFRLVLYQYYQEY